MCGIVVDLFLPPPPPSPPHLNIKGSSAALRLLVVVTVGTLPPLSQSILDIVDCARRRITIIIQDKERSIDWTIEKVAARDKRTMNDGSETVPIPQKLLISNGDGRTGQDTLMQVSA